MLRTSYVNRVLVRRDYLGCARFHSIFYSEIGFSACLHLDKLSIIREIQHILVRLEGFSRPDFTNANAGIDVGRGLGISGELTLRLPLDRLLLIILSGSTKID